MSYLTYDPATSKYPIRGFSNPNFIISPDNSVDPYFANVILYLKGDGDNNSTTIIDSSSYNKVLTPGSTSVIKTDQSKYGGSSLLFNGNLNSTIAVSNSESTGTGDFTFEAWIYMLATEADGGLFNLNGESNNQCLAIISGKLISYFISTSYYPQSPNTLPLNTWIHVALTRESGRLKLWENGVFAAQSSLSASTLSYTIESVGVTDFRNTFNGYADSMRITAGVARYTANFDPETDTYLAY